MGNGTTAKEGLGDLNEMKSVKKHRKNAIAVQVTH